MLAGVAATLPAAAGATGGYNWETAVLSPHESWEEAELRGPYLRAGPYQHFSVADNGTLDVPYRIGLRHTGSFTCLAPAEVTVEVRFLSPGDSWSVESLQPTQRTRLTFNVEKGAHPDGVNWSFQEGPALAINWDLRKAPADANAMYVVTAFPVPVGQKPQECQPANPDDGIRYLSRLNVTRPARISAAPTPPLGGGGLAGLSPHGTVVTALTAALICFLQRRGCHER